MIDTTVLSEINTKKTMKLSGRQPARSHTLSRVSTPSKVSYLGLYASFAIHGVEVTMRVPCDKMAPTLRWYPQARPTHAFYSDEGKKCQLGDKKLRGSLNFEEIVCMFFHKIIISTVEEEVFEQSSLIIYSFWGNSV